MIRWNPNFSNHEFTNFQRTQTKCHAHLLSPPPISHTTLFLKPILIFVKLEVPKSGFALLFNYEPLAWCQHVNLYLFQISINKLKNLDILVAYFDIL